MLADFIPTFRGYLASSDAMEYTKLSRTDIASATKKHRSHISFQAIYITSYFMQYKNRKIWFWLIRSMLYYEKQPGVPLLFQYHLCKF